MAEIGQRTHAGDLHLFVDRRRADVERSLEDEREAQQVIHLVREVGPAGGDDRVRPRSLRQVRHDLRHRVGEREDDRSVSHPLDHLGGQDAGGGQSQEQIGAGNGVGERPCRRLPSISCLLRRHPFRAPGVDDPLVIDEQHVFPPRAQAQQQIQTSDAGGAAAGRDDAEVLDRLPHATQRVQHGGADDDRRAVLVVVQHRDLHSRAQQLFDDEAIGRLDVFEIDGAEAGLERRDDVGEFLRVCLRHLDVEHIDSGELLEENGLSLHHRLRRQRADVAEAEHGRTVADDGDEIAAGRVPRRVSRILDNGEAGLGHAGRVGERQVVLIGERLGGRDGEFSRPRELVIIERLTHRRSSASTSCPRRCRRSRLDSAWDRSRSQAVTTLFLECYPSPALRV